MPSKTHKKSKLQCSVRYNCERPPPRNLGVFPHNGSSVLPTERLLTNPLAQLASKPTNKKYVEPQLNSVLGLQNEINLIQAQKVPPLTTLDTAQLTPRTKAAIAPKVTQKMNFRPESTVFKNLLPLNVNDSVIQPRKLKTQRRSKSTAMTESKGNTYEPELRDFVEELDKLEYVIPEPELELCFYNEKFNFLQSYKDVYD